MAKEQVTVSAGGQSFSSWMDVSAEAGAAQAARSFAVTASEPGQAFGDAWPLQPGVNVTVSASGDPIVTGIIDDYSPEYGGEGDSAFHHAKIAGRSKAKDAIDSSAVHKTGEWKNKKITDIGSDLLQPFGLSLDTDLDDLKTIPVHRLAPGATVFQELEYLARRDKALLVGMPDGGMKLTRAYKFKMHAGGLAEGVNIKRASAKLSEKDKHDKVHARGQKNKGSGAADLRLEHVASDQTVQRYRPLIIIGEGDHDDTSIKDRADWQVARAAGWSTTAEITVWGWRDAAGALWDPTKLVFVESPKLKLSQVMAIKQVTFVQNASEGTVARLSLVDPQALGGKDGKGQSNSAWQTGSGN